MQQLKKLGQPIYENALKLSDCKAKGFFNIKEELYNQKEKMKSLSQQGYAALVQQPKSLAQQRPLPEAQNQSKRQFIRVTRDALLERLVHA